MLIELMGDARFQRPQRHPARIVVERQNGRLTKTVIRSKLGSRRTLQPERCRRSPSHNPSRAVPMGVKAPIPVMATRRFINP